MQTMLTSTAFFNAQVTAQCSNLNPGRKIFLSFVVFPAIQQRFVDHEIHQNARFVASFRSIHSPACRPDLESQCRSCSDNHYYDSVTNLDTSSCVQQWSSEPSIAKWNVHRCVWCQLGGQLQPDEPQQRQLFRLWRHQWTRDIRVFQRLRQSSGLHGFRFQWHGHRYLPANCFEMEKHRLTVFFARGHDRQGNMLLRNDLRVLHHECQLLCVCKSHKQRHAILACKSSKLLLLFHNTNSIVSVSVLQWNHIYRFQRGSVPDILRQRRRWYDPDNTGQCGQHVSMSDHVRHDYRLHIHIIQLQRR